jgi:hypothetical protein
VRFAAVPGFSQNDDSYFDSSSNENDSSWQRFGAPVATTGQQDEIAMTPGQARNLLNKFGTEALRGSMTPTAFVEGIGRLNFYATSPDMIRREIRNDLDSPIGRIVAEDPRLAGDFAKSSLGMLKQFGVNPDAAEKYIGPVNLLLEQAKKDNLLRSDVTLNEVRDKLQKPLYSAMQGFAKDNRNNPQYNELIKRSFHGGPTGWTNGPKKGEFREIRGVPMLFSDFLKDWRR